MKKQLGLLGAATLLTTTLYGATYELKKGWQNVGTGIDLNVSIFNQDDNGINCVDFVWKYGNTQSWALHVANGKTLEDYGWCGDTLETVKALDGVWVKANSDCNITIPDIPCSEDNNCTPSDDIPEIPDIESDCFECEDNSTSGGTPTGEPANVNVISCSISSGNGDINNIIVSDTNTFNTGINYMHGYFYNENDICTIQVNSSFRLWSTIHESYNQYHGQLKMTKLVDNIETDDVTITYKYPSPPEDKVYYKMTDILPAGTYKFEKAVHILSGDYYRIDSGWFFEKVE